MTALNLFLIATAAALAGVVATKYMVVDGVRKLEAEKVARASSTAHVPPSTPEAQARTLSKFPPGFKLYHVWDKEPGTGKGMTLAEFRDEYPKYVQMDDATLSEALYRTYYKERGFTRHQLHITLELWPDGNIPKE